MMMITQIRMTLSRAALMSVGAWMLLVISATLMTKPALSASPQGCARTPPCAASEVTDARGCCATPRLKATQQPAKLRWSARLSAHHLTASELPPTSAALGDEASQGDERWRALVTMELELLEAERRCQATPDERERAECERAVEVSHQDRAKLIGQALPGWEQVARQGPDEPTRQAHAYYAAVAHMATRQDQQAVALLKPLGALGAQSPWAAWAVATMGDLFYDERAWALARPMYLRAQTMQAQARGLRAYAGAQSAWCAAAQGGAEEAFREVVESSRLVLSRPAAHQVQGERLRREVLSDLSALYAQLGAPAQAAALAKAVGMDEPTGRA